MSKLPNQFIHRKSVECMLVVVSSNTCQNQADHAAFLSHSLDGSISLGEENHFTLIWSAR
jgi:transcriptional antiterminator Rof (Rho-off)